LKLPLVPVEVNFNPFQVRSTLSDPPDWLRRLYGIPTSSGSEIAVNEANAMSIDAVYSAVRIIAEDTAKIPWMLYQRDGNGDKHRATGHRLYPILHDRPNPYMSSFTFRRYIQTSVLLWGNGYAEIQFDNAGRPIALWPLRPECTKPKILTKDATGTPIDPELHYETDAPNGRKIMLPDWKVFHIKGMGDNPWEGVSVVTYARRSFALIMGAEEYGASFFGNHQQPSGILKHPKLLSPQARKNLQESIQTGKIGARNAHKLMLLEEGLEFQQMSMSNQDSQFLESRKFGVNTVARWFRMKPHKMGDLGESAYSNIEAEERSYVNDCLVPWIVQWEQEANLKLISAAQRSEYFSEFLIDAMLRGDFAARMQGYAVGRQWGFLSANDIRRLENLNSIGEQGDIYMVPLNMIPAENVGKMPDPATEPAVKTDPQQAREALLIGRISAAHLGMLNQAAERMVKREGDSLLRAWNKSSGKDRLHAFSQSVEELYKTFPEAIARTFLPVASTFAASVRSFHHDDSPEDLASINARVSEIASQYCERSRGELAAAIVSGDADKQIPALLDKWTTRATALCQSMFAAIQAMASEKRSEVAA
jgi:HK97 family phage portal protein